MLLLLLSALTGTFARPAATANARLSAAVAVRRSVPCAAQVKSASFAPMLNNVNGTQWDYNMLNFDSHRLYALPSYYMQRMFREGAGDSLLASTLQGPGGSDGPEGPGHSDPDAGVAARAATGGVTLASAVVQGTDLVIKLAAYTAEATELAVELGGFAGGLGESGALQTLTSAAGADAANTLDAPTFVSPTEPMMVPVGESFTVHVPAWSVSVLRIPLAQRGV